MEIIKSLLNRLKLIFKNPLKIIVFIFFLVLLIFGVKKVISNQQQPQYQTSKVERGTIVSSVSASGQVLSVNIISANTKASGIVKEVYVKDGDYVKKGDKIMEIELDLQGQQKNVSAWASYLSAKNTLDSAKATQYSLQAEMFSKWDTFKKLAESSQYQNADGSPRYDQRALAEFHVAEKNWLAAEAKYKNQEAVITQAQVALNNAWLSYLLSSPTVTAPADGIITSLMFAKGMSIGSLDTGTTTSNQKVATIKTEGMPIVQVNLSEIDVSKVLLGYKATITLDSLPEKTFTGKVVGVDRIGTTTSNVTQYPAIIQLDSSSEEILPNMTVTAHILIESKDNVLLVPSSAIQSQGEQNFVRILKNNQEQIVPVEIGLQSDTQTEIISGLNEGDTVIIGKVSSSTNTQQGRTSPFGGGMGGVMRIVR